MILRGASCSRLEEKIMTVYPIHDLASAPAESKRPLDELKQAFGFIPNIAGTMAESPVLLSALAGVFKQVHAGTFTEAEIQTLLLTNARTNRSAWPVAFHSLLALQAGVAPATVQAIRDQRLPEEPKLAALSTLARTLIELRGHLDEQTVSAFHDAGYRREQLLEAITVIAASTMTNYTANLTNPPLENAFQPHAWSE